MLFLKQKDLKRRKLFQKIENAKRVDQFLSGYLTLSLNKNKENLLPLIKLQIKNQKYSKVKINRRCILSNRNRGVLRKYSISRIVLNDLLEFGIIPGSSKAVW